MVSWCSNSFPAFWGLAMHAKACWYRLNSSSSNRWLNGCCMWPCHVVSDMSVLWSVDESCSDGCSFCHHIVRVNFSVEVDWLEVSRIRQRNLTQHYLVNSPSWSIVYLIVAYVWTLNTRDRRETYVNQTTWCLEAVLLQLWWRCNCRFAKLCLLAP